MTNSVTVTETTNTVSVNETTNQVTVTQGSNNTATITTTGPQGEAGPTGVAGPTGAGIPTLGETGNIIIKSSYNNYDIAWSATVDGGTFN